MKNGDEVIVIKTIRNVFIFEFLESMRRKREEYRSNKKEKMKIQ